MTLERVIIKKGLTIEIKCHRCNIRLGTYAGENFHLKSNFPKGAAYILCTDCYRKEKKRDEQMQKRPLFSRRTNSSQSSKRPQS